MKPGMGDPEQDPKVLVPRAGLAQPLNLCEHCFGIHAFPSLFLSGILYVEQKQSQFPPGHKKHTPYLKVEVSKKMNYNMIDIIR